MKFKLNKVGLIDHAEIELKSLTIICGENNTGKTYVTYALYGFLRSWRSILQDVLRNRIEERLKTGETPHIDLNQLFSGKINEYLTQLTKIYTSILPRVFAANAGFFSASTIVIKIDNERDFIPENYHRSIKDSPAGKTLATLSKEAGSPLLKVLVADDELVSRPFGGLTDFVSDAIADIVFAPYLPDTFIASAERTGAAIFRKELDFARTRMFQALGSLDAKELRNPFRLMEQMEAGYAWPVQDNVDFVRQLEDIDKITSSLAESHPELTKAFDAIIGGSYKVIKDKGLVYQPKGADKPRLSMSESSSSVRALLDIGFYLRCRAKAGDLLMIDEPELNLHPKNQRALARLIARLVNVGIKVFMTTHSDYLIKELNTLIMLNTRTPHTQAVQQAHGYENDELLDPARVCLFMTCTQNEKREGKGNRAKQNTLRQARIHTGFGIEVETFDTTIEDMNGIQSEILYGGDL